MQIKPVQPNNGVHQNKANIDELKASIGNIILSPSTSVRLHGVLKTPHTQNPTHKPVAALSCCSRRLRCFCNTRGHHQSIKPLAGPIKMLFIIGVCHWLLFLLFTLKIIMFILHATLFFDSLRFMSAHFSAFFKSRIQFNVKQR